MIDFHTHTFLSDGALEPAEHIRRAEVAGYRVLGISDHAGPATLEHMISIANKAALSENKLNRIIVFCGVELTHVRPVQIAAATNYARELGAQYVIVHGETICEPVEAGTNRAAIEAGADILAHPGLISLEDAQLAEQRGVMLEISSKAGHSLCNGHVVAAARQTGAKLIFGSDAHTPDQMPTRSYAEKVATGAGLTPDELEKMFRNAENFCAKMQNR
ncbi:MAG: histidinol phosphate phosphatase domain-containing protein [Phycisphaerae bacterium]|nr:histidinol phosphate phosphatase domain-containing protein [Phycisphaerae bacterium]